MLNRKEIFISLLTIFVLFSTACGKKQTKGGSAGANAKMTNTPALSEAPGIFSTPELERSTVSGANDLVGAWVSTCHAVDERYIQEKLIIQADGKTEKITQDFMEATCETPAQRESVAGTAAFGPILSALENVKAIDLTLGLENSHTIYQVKNGKLCFGNAMSPHTPENRPSQITCDKSFTRI